MKNIILMLVVITALLGCEDDLEKQPDFISEDSVFEDENLTEAYIANLYSRVEFQQDNGVSLGNISSAGAEYTGFANWQAPNQVALRDYITNTGPGPLDEWRYPLLRDMNNLLGNIESSANLSEEFIDAKIAEVRFLRAFQYFNQVKNFGGVPLVLEAQDVDLPREEYNVPRNSEEEVYDFIYNEIQEILPFFSDEATGATGRVDKYAALMLQSRAMLYAASIAENGTPLTNEYVGIPSSRADEFYKKSYDASKEIIDSGMFNLVNSGNDKAANFSSIFFNEGNSEVILSEVFEPFLRGHDFTHMGIPDGFGSTWNSNWAVFYEMIELYDFTDGRSGMIDRSQFTSDTEWDIDDFFGNRDPRLRSSIFYPETVYLGEKVYFHSSLISGNTTSSNEGELFTNAEGEEVPGAAPRRNRVNTGLLARKRVAEDALTDYGSSGVDYIQFRYAETLLNYAEAAFYLNRNGEALDAINQIRDRAGMPLRTLATEENIRQERQVELMFEDHRYYDLLRWRIADDVLSERTTGLIFTYNLDTDMYRITLKNGESYQRRFGNERYYLPFDFGRLNENPNMVQNSGYE